ncbi:MAG: MFS transporter [Oscillospiraceae bacterium]|nr:MFS transporter [Oscillospiraceae bacterium]
MRKIFSRHNLLSMGIQSFYWGTYCMFFGFLVMYMQNHGYTNLQCAQFQMAIAVATLVTQPLYGYLADTYVTCKRIILVVSALSVPLAFLFPAVIGTPLLAFGAVVLQSILLYNTTSIIDMWIMQLREVDHNINYGLTRSASSIVYSVSCLIYGNLIAKVGEWILTPSFAVFSALLLVCVLLLEEVPCKNTGASKGNREGRISGFGAVKLLACNKPYVIFILSQFFLQIVMKGLGNFTNNFVVALGGASGELGAMYFVSSLCEVPILCLVERLIKRVKLERIYLVILTVTAMRMLCLYFGNTMFSLVCAQALNGMAYAGNAYLVIEYICRNTPNQLNFTALTLGLAITGALGGITGNYVVGLLIDTFGLKTLVLFMLGMTVLALAAFSPCLWMSRPKKQAAEIK